MIRPFFIGLLSFVCIVVFLWVLSLVVSRSVRLPGTGGQPMLPTMQLTIGSTTITVELATTPQEEGAGLSGRTSLAEGRGMLFAFDPPQMPGFWMKDMRFPLDIIYAASDGTIVTIYPDLSPATYPRAFYPSAPVKYVLEVPAGYAASHSIAVGQKIVVQ